MVSVLLADTSLIRTRELGAPCFTTESLTAHEIGIRTQAPHHHSGHPFHGCSSRVGAVVF